MTDFKHTPGPWRHAGNGDVETLSSDAICTTDACNEVDIADALLIAAAPEMAELVAKLARWANEAERNPSFGDDFPVYAYGDVAWTLGELKAARALCARIKGESA